MLSLSVYWDGSFAISTPTDRSNERGKQVNVNIPAMYAEESNEGVLYAMSEA